MTFRSSARNARIAILALSCLAPAACGDDDPSGPRGGDDPESAVISRDSAVTLARKEVIGPLATDCFIIALAPREVLPAGTEIRQIVAEPDDLPSFTVERGAYLVYVDLVPTHQFHHPVRYVLVDAATGEITVHDALSQPIVDGELLYAAVEENLASPDRIHPAGDVVLEEASKRVCPRTLEYESGASAAVASRSPRGAPGPAPADGPRRVTGLARADAATARTGGRKVAVTVAGSQDNGNPATAAAWADLLGSLGFEVTELSSATHDLGDVIETILNVGEPLGPADKFVLVLVGHSLRRDPDGDGRPNDLGAKFAYRYDEGPLERQIWLYRRDPEARDIPSVLERIEAGRVDFFLETCYAGVLARRMTGEEEDFAFDPQPGTEVLVFPSAMWSRSSDGGSPAPYTSVVHARVEEFGFDQDARIGAIQSALAFGHQDAMEDLSGFFGQRPPMWSSFPAADLIVAEPVDLSAEHFVGVTECPQVVGTVTLTNPSDDVAEWEAAPEAPLEVQPAAGTLESGGSVTVDILFSCNTRESFRAGVTFHAFDPAAEARAAQPTRDDEVTVDVDVTIHVG